MAQRTAAGYKTVADSRFADNTTGLIEEIDHRDQHTDAADSFMNILDHAYTSYIATAAGTDTYTATLSPAITAYAATQKYFIQFTNANTGAATLNFNGLGAKAIVKNGTTALSSGDIAAGQIYQLHYDGTNLQIVGSIGGGGTTLASGVYTPTLTGTANVDAVVVQGADWPYMRVGSVVTVSGQINIDPTASATTTSVRISLPIASNFASSNVGLAGTMVETGGASNVGAIRPEPTSDEAQIVYVPTATTAKSFSLVFTYSII
jgi:hypothetical protein